MPVHLLEAIKCFLKLNTEKSINSEYGKMELKGSVHEFESDD